MSGKPVLDTLISGAAQRAGMLAKLHTGAYSYIGGADLAAEIWSGLRRSP